MRGDMPVSEPDWHEQLLCDIRQGAVSRVVSAHRDLKGFFAVIVDLRMPDMDGIEVTRQIRAQAGCPRSH